jgi:acyl-CoA reductase-like NAD-dependent aldehyde dehydrogenase
VAGTGHVAGHRSPPDAALRAVAFGCFCHQGQICLSTERVIVQSSIVDAFIARLLAKARSLRVGDPAEPRTQLGPIIHRAQFDEIPAPVTEAVGAGATLLCGGEPSGPFHPPTVLGGVTPAMRLARDETFGPSRCHEAERRG